MKKIRVFFLSENVQFLEAKFSIYLNRRVFIMLVAAHKYQHLSHSSGPESSLGIFWIAKDAKFLCADTNTLI